MPELVAKETLRYASRDMKAGDQFAASESDAHVLISTGKAEAATAGADESRQGGGELLSGKQGQSKSRRGGKYQRADVRAED